MPSSVEVILRARKELFDAAMKSVGTTLNAVIARMEVLGARAKSMLLYSSGVLAGLILLATQEEAAQQKLGAVLRSTGYAAGFSAGELTKQASALQELTTFGDEAIVNLQAILATFTQIKGDNFTAATRAALDMSAVLGQDLKESATQLGKALNDPVLGVTALRRVGVSFNASQTEVIKNLAQTGRVAEAQALILKELSVEFGGAAEAASKSGTGGIKQLKNALSDVGEVLGSVVVPVVTSFLSGVQSVVQPVAEWAKANRGLANALTTATFAVLGLLALLPRLVTTIKILTAATIAFKNSALVAFAFGGPLGMAITAIVSFLAVGAGLLLWFRQYDKEQKQAADAARDYSDTLRRIGEAAKAVREAKTDEERVEALRRRIRLEEDAMKKADAQHAELHQKNIERLVDELSGLQQNVQSIDDAAKAKQESFEKELEAAQLAAEQAGKSREEQERLALAAKGYTEEQIAQIQNARALEAERSKAAEAAKKAEEEQAQRHEKAKDAVNDLLKDIARLQGMGDEAIELFDLANLGHAVEDIEQIASLMQYRVQAQTAKETEELRKQLQERLAGEAQVTAEKQAQAVASMAGRFEGLTDAWQRIQTAAVQAPIQREAEQMKTQREIKDVNERIAKIEEEAKEKLNEIAQTLHAIKERPPLAFE